MSRPIVSSRDQTTVTGVPNADRMSSEEQIELLQKARDAGHTGKSVPYDTLMAPPPAVPTSRTNPPVQSPPSADSQRYEAMARSAQGAQSNLAGASDATRLNAAESTMLDQRERMNPTRNTLSLYGTDVPVGETGQEAQQQAQSSGTDVLGLLGAATRGAAPYVGPALLGAATGTVAAAGAAVAPAMIVTDAIMGLVNQIAGTNFPSTREAFNQLLTKIGVAEPDSLIEELVQRGVDSVGQAHSFLQIANLLAPAATQLMAPTATQAVAQQMTTMPGSQLSGAFRAPFGEEAGRRTAQALDMGETGQQVMGMIGGIGADMTASVTPMPGKRAAADASERLASSGLSVDDARRAIQIGDQAGVTVRRSDIFPPDTPSGHLFQGIIDSFGGAKLAGDINRGRNRLARGMFEEYSLQPGAIRNFAPELAEEFASNRQTAFNRYGRMVTDALDSVPKVDPTTGNPYIVQTPTTLSFIDNKIEELTALGGLNANVNTATSVVADATDAAARNPYSTMVNQLKSWRASFQNNTLDQLDINRSNFGDMFIPDQGYSQLNRAQRDVVSGVYDSVRNDIGEAIRTGPGGEAAFRRWREANLAMFEMQKDLNQEVIGNLLSPVQGLNNVAIARGELPIEELSREARRTVERFQQSPELLENIIVNGTPSQIQTVLPFMSTEGRRTALSAMLYNDMRHSIPDVRNLSGNALSKNLQESFLRRDIAMTDVDRELIDGIGLFLDVTKRAEPTAMRPPGSVTSSMPTPPGAMGMALRGMASSVGALAGTIFGVGVAGRNISYMYESPYIRDLLLDLVETGVSSPKSTNIVLRIAEALAPSAQRAPLMTMAGVRSMGRDVSERLDSNVQPTVGDPNDQQITQ